MQNSHLKNSLIAAGIAVFAGVVTLGANVAFGDTSPGALPSATTLVSPTFGGLTVTGNSTVSGTLTATKAIISGLPAGTVIADTTGTLSTVASVPSLWTGSLTGIISNGNSGNVGIGTSTPVRKLEVNNAMKFTNTAADPNDGVIGTAPFAPGLNIVGINTDSTKRKINIWGGVTQNENNLGNFWLGDSYFPGSGIWSSSGNVGVGTTNSTLGKVVSVTTNGFNQNPSFVATTPGSSTSEKSYYSMYSTFGSGADLYPRRTADIVAGFNAGTWGKEFLTLNVGNYGNGGDMLPGDLPMPTAERMRIQSNGNVGINTSSPTSNFVVNQPTTGFGTVQTLLDNSLTGTGTQFTNTFKVGDSINVATTPGAGGLLGSLDTRVITAISSDTYLTVNSAFSTSKANLKYTLAGGDRFTVKGNGNVNASGKITSGGGFGTITQYSSSSVGAVAIGCANTSEKLLSCGGSASGSSLSAIVPSGTWCIASSPSSVTVYVYAICMDPTK